MNAARHLPATLASIACSAELVIVDGGSSDGTVALAQQHGARVVTAPRGRGQQLAAGVALATRPWLLLLHADTRLSSGWIEAIGEHMRRDADRAGYFRFVLDSSDPRARRLERAVAWRSRAMGLPYGDQGLLIATGTLSQVGGIAAIPLMEDVDLVRRIGRHRLRLLAADAITSAEKWEHRGYLRRSAQNLACLGLWFAGVKPGVIRRLYG